MLKYVLLISFLHIFPNHAKDIEETLNAPETIAHFGYPVEKHYVTTEDGYTIEMHRIPYGRDLRLIDGCPKRPVVFLMHGLFATSYAWLFNLPSQSAAYVFADAGFDVWLGNIRGTEYGLNHTTLRPEQQSFWNFSLYEHAHFDLRDQIDHVLEVTQHDNLFYVGHSQGTTIMFARLAEAEKEWQKKIRMFFALGPTAGFVKPMMPFSILENGYLQKLVQFVFDGKFGLASVTMPKSLTSAIAQLCSSSILGHLCLKTFTDGSEILSQFNESRLPVITSHYPAATSTLNMLHWMQIFKFHEIRKLDFGESRNLKVYGTKEAPRLDIGRIETPTILYFSKDDKITDEVDVREVLIKQMGPGLIDYFELDHFTHIDYAIGLRATEEVYRPLVFRIYQELNKTEC